MSVKIKTDHIVMLFDNNKFCFFKKYLFHHFNFINILFQIVLIKNKYNNLSFNSINMSIINNAGGHNALSSNLKEIQKTSTNISLEKRLTNQNLILVFILLI